MLTRILWRIFARKGVRNPLDMPVFKYSTGGSLMVDRAIPGVTKYNSDISNAVFYGGRFFVAESMTETAAKRIAESLGGIYAGKGEFEVR